MREQIIVYQETLKQALTDREYKVTFVKPAAATVQLVSHTKHPKHAMYVTTRAYKGVYNTGYDYQYTDDQAFNDIMNTKLQTPMEMVHMLWLLKDVTRAFTHQLVRYRVGTSFVQESMRFFGMRDEFKILVSGEASGFRGNHIATDYFDAGVIAVKGYVDMLAMGVPDQDARGVLPTNILTSIFFDCSLRTLQNIMPQRLCCQAQPGEWQPILREMRSQIRSAMGSEIEGLLRAPYELGKECGYRASFDRPCTWKKEKV